MVPVDGHHSDVEDNGRERSCSVHSEKSDPEKWVEQLTSHLNTVAPEDTVDFMLDDKGNSLFLPVKDIQELCARTQEELCLTIPRVWVVYIARLCAQLGRSDVYGFIDPCHIQGGNDRAVSRSHISKKLLEDNKHCYLAPYLKNKHWQLIIIEPRKQNVVFLCSLGKKPDEDIVKIVNSAMVYYNGWKGFGNQTEATWSTPVCQRQPSSYECGYYVMIHIWKIVSGGIRDWEQITGDSKPFPNHEIRNVQELCAELILKGISNTD